MNLLERVNCSDDGIIDICKSTCKEMENIFILGIKEPEINISSVHDQVVQDNNLKP